MSGYVPRKLRAASRQRPKSSGATALKTPAKATGKPAKATKSSGSTKTGVKVPAQRRPSPHPETAKPSPQRRRPSPHARRPVRKRRELVTTLKRLAAALAIGAVVAAALAGAAVWASINTNSADQANAATRAAKTAAAALFSYDYRDFDASITNGAAHATGLFATEYKKETEGLRELVVTEKAKVVADVVDVAVLNTDVTYTEDQGKTYQDAVEVMAFMDHTITNATIEGSKIDQTRVVLTMVAVDGRWLVVHATSM